MHQTKNYTEQKLKKKLNMRQPGKQTAKYFKIWQKLAIYFIEPHWIISKTTTHINFPLYKRL